MLALALALLGRGFHQGLLWLRHRTTPLGRCAAYKDSQKSASIFMTESQYRELF
jgi:hypothetical protein